MLDCTRAGCLTEGGMVHRFQGKNADRQTLGKQWLSQAEAEAQEEEAERGEDDGGLDHPQQVEDDALVQAAEEVDAREAGGGPVPVSPPAQRGGQRADAQRPPRRLLLAARASGCPGHRRRHLLPQPLPLPPAGHRLVARPIDQLVLPLRTSSLLRRAGGEATMCRAFYVGGWSDRDAVLQPRVDEFLDIILE